MPSETETKKRESLHKEEYPRRAIARFLFREKIPDFL